MDFYISAGQFLPDKDRSNNTDSAEIQKFFEPIDRLFGDYEIRAKFNLTETLYRYDSEGEHIAISKKEINENRGKLLCFFLYKNISNYEIMYDWVDPKGLSKVVSNVKLRKEANEKIKAIKSKADFLAYYILDPIKLHQIIDLDTSRIKSYKNALLLSVLGNENFSKASSYYFEKIDTIATHFRNGNTLSFKYNKKNEIIAKILKKFEEKDPLAKPKNFEACENVKLRLGQYKDSRYVIFMHPYESESNSPGRVPTE